LTFYPVFRIFNSSKKEFLSFFQCSRSNIGRLAEEQVVRALRGVAIALNDRLKPENRLISKEREKEVGTMRKRRMCAIVAAFVMSACVTVGTLWAAEQVTLRVAHTFAVDHPYSTACEMLVKEVAEKTKGQVAIKHYPAGQLGKDNELTDQLIKGTIDLMPAGPTAVGRYFDPLNCLQVYYLVDSPQQLLKIMRGPIGQKLFEELRQKLEVRIMDVMYYGRRHILTTKKPINKPQDLKGLKIRSMPTPFLKTSLEAMGPTGVPIDMAEVYIALQTGVVDGLENTPVSVRLEKYHEVAKYYSLTGHSVHPSLWNMSDKSWKAKVPEDAKPIVAAAIQRVTEWEIAEMERQEKEALVFLKDKGVQIIEVDREPFRKEVQKVYPEMEKRFGESFKAIVRAAAEMK
jgi:tripartite ATP-independent transporter DctP family solute receptor